MELETGTNIWFSKSNGFIKRWLPWNPRRQASYTVFENLLSTTGVVEFIFSPLVLMNPSVC